MPRALQEDYSDLINFINDYSIKHAYNDESLAQVVKPIHKGYFSAIVLLAELKHQSVQPALSVAQSGEEEQRILFWLHLSESFSELGSAFFLILNGCYKASDQVLRSSIENFVKSLGSIDKTDLTKIKNLYEVFEIAGTSIFFSSKTGKEIFKELSDLYGILCSTVHTGTEQNMQNISALGDFPAIDDERGKMAKDRFLKIVKLYVSALSLMFKEAFHNMHHRNLDVVKLSLMAGVLKELHE